MKSNFFILFIALVFWSCNGRNGDAKDHSEKSNQPGQKTNRSTTDDGKGIGEIKVVHLNDTLDTNMVNKGKALFEIRCSSCHNLTDKQLVGPGFLGITNRRKPEWIMNMITNVDIMLDSDPTSQKLFEECLSRMPNQNISYEDARSILEFLYSNDAS